MKFYIYKMKVEVTKLTWKQILEQRMSPRTESSFCDDYDAIYEEDMICPNVYAFIKRFLKYMNQNC